MVHIIPLFTDPRRPGPSDTAPAAPPGSLDPYWQEVAAHYERRMARQQAFDTEIAARRLHGEIASAEADTLADAPADGEGLHHAMYGEVDPHTGRVVLKGRFDTLFDNFLKQAPPELRAGLVGRKPALREAGSVRMAMQQNQRRAQYEQDQLAAVQAEELDTIAKSDPDDTAAFDASRHAGLDLIAKMNLNPESRQKAESAWRENTAKARIEALIARDPKRALEMLSAGPVASHRRVDDPGAEPLADLSSDNVRRLLGNAHAATGSLSGASDNQRGEPSPGDHERNENAYPAINVDGISKSTARNLCIDFCTDATLPTGTYNGDPFYYCMARCMEKYGF